MAHQVGDVGRSDEAIRARAAKLIRRDGPNAAALALGVSRETVLSMAAGAIVRPATFALVREHLSRASGPDDGLVAEERCP